MKPPPPTWKDVVAIIGEAAGWAMLIALVLVAIAVGVAEGGGWLGL